MGNQFSLPHRIITEN